MENTAKNDAVHTGDTCCNEKNPVVDTQIWIAKEDTNGERVNLQDISLSDAPQPEQSDEIKRVLAQEPRTITAKTVDGADVLVLLNEDNAMSNVDKMALDIHNHDELISSLFERVEKLSAQNKMLVSELNALNKVIQSHAELLEGDDSDKYTRP